MSLVRRRATMRQVGFPRGSSPIAFGTLLTSTSVAAAEYAGGTRLMSHELDWAAYEPTNGSFSSSYAANQVAQRDSLLSTGAKLNLHMAMHYTPSWVNTVAANAKYVDQNGALSSEPNFVFCQAVRDQGEQYMARVHADLDLNNYWNIRLTSASGVEVVYPGVGNYWAYDAGAQGGSGRPSTVAACPYPGWESGQTTITLAQVREWAEWYIRSLTDTVNWQMAYMRGLGYKGWFELLCPGWGVRPNAWETSIANRLPTGLMGYGPVWFKIFEYLNPRAGAMYRCTSTGEESGAADIPLESDTNIGITDSASQNWSAARFATRIAREYGMPMTGENPGWGDTGDTHYTNTGPTGLLASAVNQAAAGKFMAFDWAHSFRLWDGTMPFSNYAAKIAATNGGNNPLPPDFITLIVQDSFNRTVTGGLGSADSGGAYTIVGGGDTDFSVANGAATIVSPLTGSDRKALLAGATWRLQDVRLRVKSDKLAVGSQQAVHMWLREKDTADFYRVTMLWNTNQTVDIALYKLVVGVTTLLATATVSGLSHAADSYIWLRAQAQGAFPTTVRARAWADGTAEPATWAVTTTDSQSVRQSSGAFGFVVSSGGGTNSPVTFTVADLTGVSGPGVIVPGGVTYDTTVLANSPVAYWRLGESSGTTAATETGASTGTYTNATLGAASLLTSTANTCVDLNGTTAYVLVADAAALDFTTAMTIEAWIRPDTLPTFSTVVTKINAYTLQLAGARVRFDVWLGGVKTNWDTGRDLVAGTTYHLVATYNGITRRLYVNGVEQGSGLATTGSVSVSADALRVGSWDGSSEFFDGRIDEVAVYNTALTVGDALAHYQAGSA